MRTRVSLSDAEAEVLERTAVLAHELRELMGLVMSHKLAPPFAALPQRRKFPRYYTAVSVCFAIAEKLALTGQPRNPSTSR